MKDFNQWLCDIKCKSNVEKHQERLHEYHKERERVFKVKGYVFWNGEQICKLSKKYDNNIAIKNIIREQRIADKHAKRLNITYDKAKKMHCDCIEQSHNEMTIKRKSTIKAMNDLFQMLGI